MRETQYAQPQKVKIVGIVVDWLLRFEDMSIERGWVLGPYRNKVVQGGLENLADLIIGGVPSETAAAHIVIGSNSAPAQSDDDLSDIGEVARKALASKSRQGATARLRAFFLADEANGDHQCLGLVARSTDVAGTGTLLSRLVQPFSKDSNTVLTVEVRWTFTEVV